MHPAIPARLRSLESRAFALLLLGLALIALTIDGGCDDEKKITSPPLDSPPYLDQGSAANVLTNLRVAYQRLDFVAYEKLFATDFIFVFNPADVDDPINPTPPQWARADEMDSAMSIFADSLVEGISLSWSVGELTEDDIYGSKVRVDNVRLDVTTRNEIGEVWMYQVKGATHVFYFRQEDTTTPFGHKKWTCMRWEDSPIEFARSGVGEQGPAVERTTWGQIKAHYR